MGGGKGDCFAVSKADLALATVPGMEFDPAKRFFTAEELKPQPIIKKRKKVRLLSTWDMNYCSFEVADAELCRYTEL